LAIALAGSAAADPVMEFTNSSRVNLLECWKPDGSYGLGVTITCTYLYGSMGTETVTDMYARDDSIGAGGFYPVFLWTYAQCGAGFAHSYTLGEDRIVEVTFDFGREVTIGELACVWRARDHAANRYEWVDERGTVVAGAYDPARFTGSYSDTPNVATTGTVATSKLTYRVYLDGMSSSDPGPYYHNAGLAALGVYLADGEQLSMKDGTYNIFYQETAPATGNVDGRWTDQTLATPGGKPSFPTGSCQWEFSQAYELFGMIFTLYDNYDQFGNGRYLGNAKLEISMTGEEGDWETVWEREKLYWFRDAEVYIPFDVEAIGQFVRLSWDNTDNLIEREREDGSTYFTSNEVEINEFQLFGRPYVPVPEPATMALLALGGLALLRRRR